MGTEAVDIVVGAESTGGGAAFSVDVRCGWKEVLACEEELGFGCVG
jgi:hypothetical protein